MIIFIKLIIIYAKENQKLLFEEIHEAKNSSRLLVVTIHLYVCGPSDSEVLGVILIIAGEMFHISCAQRNCNAIKDVVNPKYLILSSKYTDNEYKQVRSVLDRCGYKRTTNNMSWDLIWSLKCLFSSLDLHSLKPHQRVNHIPGMEVVTCKHIFATRNVSKNIPKAFVLPKDKIKFWKYASRNKQAMFVEKNNNHRGVKLTKVKDVDLGGKKFVQEFIQNPFLVDNYKFDIGVFVVITSVDPLRMYHYNGDVFLRFCPEKYYPFDPLNLKKYVVTQNYRPIWKIPVLEEIHNKGYSMRNSLNFYLRSKGKNPRKVWREVFNVLRVNLVNKAQNIKFVKNYAYPRNFFEIIRVDLILDQDMKVHLMEANLSPRLASVHKPLQLLDDQVLLNMLSLVGLDSPFRNHHVNYTLMNCKKKLRNDEYKTCKEHKAGAESLSANKSIAVLATECVNFCKENCDGICAVCSHCLTFDDRVAFIEAYREHLRQGDFRRLFPPPMKPRNLTLKSMKTLKHLTRKNRLLFLWYQGKCNANVAWCY